MKKTYITPITENLCKIDFVDMICTSVSFGGGLGTTGDSADSKKKAFEGVWDEPEDEE